MITGPVAFCAPLKSPNHPTPSGDRTMARGMLRLLGDCGFAPELVSELRLFDGQGDLARGQLLARAAAREADRYIADCQARDIARRPVLAFTYHCYFKAPDVLGPRIARAFAIPYVVAEPSSAAKRRHGRWAFANELAEAAFDAADALLPMTRRDEEAMLRRRAPGQALHYFPPFLPVEAAQVATGSPRPVAGPPHLLTVAMMRESNKRASYLALAAALRLVEDEPWRLTIAGDGPARREIAAAFAPFGARVTFLGLLSDAGALDALYRSADLFVWPGVTEAYGMSLLEAQARGLPCLAGRDGGVPDVVADGQSGLLTPPGDAPAFAAALRRLLHDAELRARLGAGAARFVGEERSLPSARRRMTAILAEVMARFARARQS